MPDPLSSAIAGKAADEASKQAKVLAAKLLNRDAAFLQDPSTVASVRDARKTAEYLSLRRFVEDRHERVLLQLGIVWRGYQGDQTRIERERAKVIRAHGLRGLHLAEAMQAGLLALIENELAQIGLSAAALRLEMRAVVDEIDEFVTFIQTESSSTEELSVLMHKARSFYPRVFVVAGSGKAVEVAIEVAREASKRLRDYRVRREQSGQQIAFVFSAVP